MKKYILLSCLISLHLSCNEVKILDDCLNQQTILPLETCSGLHTFGCKIDGKNWTPYSPNPLDYLSELDKPLDADDENSYLHVWAARTKLNECEKNKMYIKLNVFDHKLGKNDYKWYGSWSAWVLWDKVNDKQYYCDTTYDNFVFIDRLDKNNKIACGTFQFRLISYFDTKDTILITSGRFDLDTKI